MSQSYPIVPGRGLTSRTGTQQRLEYLEQLGLQVKENAACLLQPDQIRNNIESFVGVTEIPLGLAGPLLYRQNNKEEFVHALAGTLEGALLASMNRGAKAVSLSGGFSAHLLHQKMIRTPMFIFRNLAEGMAFKQWAEASFLQIKAVAEQYSNHARLTDILPYVAGKSVHLKFVYTTGDATGQNMTTTCTWHAILWMQKQFEQETGISIVHYVIEGNGASDKKVSGFSISHGRGVHVVAECHLKEEVIVSVLRTNSADIVRCFNQSLVMSRLDGMVGYNINVANVIAALFVATGQDLGSLHESCCGVLNVEQTEDGLYLSLNLPTLVIGTVGGGTHLPRQREALELMGCYGTGKIARFASLIAGFALALEISTYAAIVSGQFAKAHEKLGRNKPVNWLLKSELNREFIGQCLNGQFSNRKLLSVELVNDSLIDNGILTGLTSRVCNKLIGFVPLRLEYQEQANSCADEAKHLRLLLKSKPLDQEVFNGLHFMAANINPALADLIFGHRHELEYRNCHRKETWLYEQLHLLNLPFTPQLYGRHTNEKREIHLLLLELLKPQNLTHFNTENQPELWQKQDIEKVLSCITAIHKAFAQECTSEEHPVQDFKPWQALPLYRKLAELVNEGMDGEPWHEQAHELLRFAEELEAEHQHLALPKTIIHNDFNPRNLALRLCGTPCIYDWELAVFNFPHRDIVEFLSFVLPPDFTEAQLRSYLHYHYNLYADSTHQPDWNVWCQGYVYALKEYLVTRVSFYLVGSLLMKYDFAGRIFHVALRMVQLLEKELSFEQEKVEAKSGSGY